MAATDTGRLDEVRAEGMEPVVLPWNRWGTNPVDLVRGFVFLLRLYRRERPALVHHVAPKPVVLGSLAARFTRGVAVVNAVTGLGYSGGSALGRLARFPLRLLYRLALRNPRAVTIFQNRDDLDAMVEAGALAPGRARLVRGSGVDPSAFTPAPEPDGPPLVVFASRLLWEKGTGVFVDAARAVRSRHPEVRFALVGAPDEGNPDSVPAERVEAWVREGAVEWWGHRTDMAAVFHEAAVVALPTSYREGLPKVLLEAAACGRPVVASTVGGCREIVAHGVNGLLVPPGDAPATAAAIEELLASPERRQRMGAAGRVMVLADLTLDAVVAQTFAVYADALHLAGHHGAAARLDPG